MRTRTIFEASDFLGCGQCVVHADFLRKTNPTQRDLAYGLTVAYKVGWMTNPDHNATHNLSTLVSLADGMVLVFENIEALVRHLNDDNVGFRQLEIDELVAILQQQGTRFP